MSHTDMKPTSPIHSKASGATNVDMMNKAATKLCHIVKRDDFDGYGFNLHSEKAKPGQFIGKVDANSPAEMAGLKEGDRIIEVNGVAINNETHKQVVQRIKAIACEVRLLLLDVDGKGDGGQQHMASNGNGQTMDTNSTKTEQILPGASENINSITMVSTKRPSSQASHNSGDNNNSMDVTDKATVGTAAAEQQEIMMNRNSGSNVPPPPSATMATANKPITMSMSMMNHSNSTSNSHNNSISSTTTTAMSSNGATMETTTVPSTSSSGGGNTSTIKAGSLQLPMTAAEMRAKLMMKKKYDPKNESVDLKKKYEIVQKL